jgi:hypothetical protein
MTWAVRKFLYYSAFSVLSVASLFVCTEFGLGTKTGADLGLELATAYFFVATNAIGRDKKLIVETTPLRIICIVAGLSSLGAFGIYFAR